MPYVAVNDFRLGMNRTRQRVAGVEGSCWTIKNGHLTRGGDIERAKKFVSTYALPSGTFGMASIGSTLYVFGSGVDPGVPAGVTYQRLQHPDGLAMTAVLDVAAFDGALYVVAEYTGSKVVHFYAGAVVNDWLAGIVRAGMTNNDGTAEHLKALIDAHADYSASRAGAVITITGPVGTAFTVATTTENVSGGTNDQTATAATTQAAVAAVSEVLATASFRVVKGSTNAGVNTVSVAVNGVTIVSAAVDWSTSNAITAANIASNINAYTSAPNYTATSNNDTVTISAAAGSGDSPNTFAVTVTTAGDAVCTNGSFTITGGTSNPGVNRVTNVTVGGVDVLGAAVDWATSHAATATAVAAQINSYSSTPDYGASADGATVYLGKKSSVSTDSSATVTIGVGGDVTTSSVVNVTPTATSMAGGVDSAAGQAQISTVTIGGTFDVGDKFNVALTKSNATVNFGFTAQPTPVADVLLTFKSKMHAAGEALVNFSAVNDATAWNRDNPGNAGAGFINASSQDEGAQDVTALAVYAGQLAIFSRSSIQLWTIDADPDLNVFLQTLENTGTLAKKSVKSYGNNDVFYLDDTGIRSLKARDSSNQAFVSDVGVAVDPFVVEFLATLTDTQIGAAQSAIEPVEGRFWLAVGTRIFVFSYFPGSKISAWSYYEPGFTVSAFARVGKKMYARAADTIYLYGGSAGTTYPSASETPCTVETPFYNGSADGYFKNWDAFDIAATNNWTIDALPDPNDETVLHRVGITTETTFGGPRLPLGVAGNHLAIKAVCSAAGNAKISKMALHYKSTKSVGNP